MTAGRHLIVSTLGDSITAGTPGWDPDPRVRAATGANDPRSQYQHWAALANPGGTAFFEIRFVALPSAAGCESLSSDPVAPSAQGRSKDQITSVTL